MQSSTCAEYFRVIGRNPVVRKVRNSTMEVKKPLLGTLHISARRKYIEISSLITVAESQLASRNYESEPR